MADDTELTSPPDDALLDRWLDGLRSSGERLAGVPADRLGAAVPACPGWDVAELLEHVGGLHWWFARRVAEAPERGAKRGEHPPPPEDPAARLAWSAEQRDLLVDALVARRTADGLTAEVRTWVGPQPAWWVARRMCHETLVHAWDAQDAAGDADALEPDLAVDAIDETFDLFVAQLFDHEGFGATGETLHLHATDAEGEWLLRFEPGVVHVVREHAKGDVAVRGPAGELLLALWGRQPFVGDGASGLEVFGDPALLERYRVAATV